MDRFRGEYNIDIDTSETILAFHPAGPVDGYSSRQINLHVSYTILTGITVEKCTYIKPSNAGTTFVQNTRAQRFWKNLNTVMLVFIG